MNVCMYVKFATRIKIFTVVNRMYTKKDELKFLNSFILFFYFLLLLTRFDRIVMLFNSILVVT